MNHIKIKHQCHFKYLIKIKHINNNKYDVEGKIFTKIKHLTNNDFNNNQYKIYETYKNKYHDDCHNNYATSITINELTTTATTIEITITTNIAIHVKLNNAIKNN